VTVCGRLPRICYDAAKSAVGGCVRVLFAAIMLLTAVSSLAATIQGRLSLSAEGKALRADQAQDAIVYFRPKIPQHAVPTRNDYTMSTARKQFVPRTLAITVGSSVRFPNQDPILHNAFSLSKNNAFDVGLYGEGDGKIVTFTHVGYVRVYCNVHHSMVGHILILDTPYFAHPDASGTFRIKNVPEVPGDLVVWHERAKAWHEVMTPGQGAVVDVQMELTQRRIPQHMNKFGKPYGRPTSGGY
jgi:plastocyanin